MTKQELESLEIPTLINLSLDELKNQEVIARIEEMGEDDQYAAEPMAAREFYETLDAVMRKYSGQFNGTREYTALYTIMQKMLWQALPALEKKMKQQLLAENLIFTVKQKIDILTNLEAYLYLYEFGVGPDTEERQIFIYALTHNQERLGNEQITLKSGETVPPHVANWIKDFSSYTDSGLELKGESYELTQYLYSSPNVKKLGADDKQILAQIITIYNHLRNPKYIPEIEKPEAPSTPQAKAPIAPKPIAPAPPATIPKPINFDQRLAQVSRPSPMGEARPNEIGAAAPVSHGADLQMLKKQVVQTESVAGPKMATAELPTQQTKEIITEAPAAKPGSVINSWSAPDKQNEEKMALTSLNEIKTMDDLKKISAGNLRQGNLNSQTQLIKSKITSIAAANRMLPYFAVTAFEASPLFQSYLLMGSAKMSGQSNADLSKEEFEAIADLRKQIETL